MKTFRCLAIDMGASSIRVLLGSVFNNHLEYKEIYRFKNEMKIVNNSYKWDIENIYSNLLKGINIALTNYSDIESLGVDSWGVDYVLIDNIGELVEMPYAYRDLRTDGMMDKWLEKMTKEETFQRTGVNFYLFNTLFQLLAAQNSSELKKASSLLFIPSYIYYRLCGSKFNEVTIASTSQLLGVFSSKFDNEIINKLGINASILPKTINPGHIIGKLTDSNLRNNQIQAVAVCCHDTASAVAAIPTADNQFAFISTGTWCILGIESEKPILSKQALELGITNERAYGNTYRVQKNIVGLWLIQGIQKAMPEAKDFSELEKMAMQKHSSQYLVDPEDEIFYNPKNMLEAFDSYFEKTDQTKPRSIGEYIKCAYTSLSLAFAYYIKKLEGLNNFTCETIHVIGGGSQSEYLCQSIANYTAKQINAGPVECATIGNIIVQAIAANKINYLNEGRTIVKNSFPPKIFKPLLKENEYERIFQNFMCLKKL